jgi:ketol-acid reductoisomerase
VVDERTREEMRRILGEIRSGEFAKEWVLEARAGYPKFEALRAAGRDQMIEEVGKGLRSMMPWLQPVGRGSSPPVSSGGAGPDA